MYAWFSTVHLDCSIRKMTTSKKVTKVTKKWLAYNPAKKKNVGYLKVSRLLHPK